jgi:hypothetical protein
MSLLFKSLPWVVAGAALYHIGWSILEQREERLLSLRVKKRAEVEARRRLFHQLARACQRGMLNNN